MKKVVEIDELVNALRKAGMEAGVCISGSSSYSLLRLAGEIEVWGYVPDPNFKGVDEDELIGNETLNLLSQR